VETVMKGMLGDIQLLASVKTVTRAQQEQMAKTITEVSVIPTSVPSIRFKRPASRPIIPALSIKFTIAVNTISPTEPRSSTACSPSMQEVAMISSIDSLTEIGPFVCSLCIPEIMRRLSVQNSDSVAGSVASLRSLVLCLGGC